MAEHSQAGSGADARPLSPHLQVYRMTITMTMSIVHRITGAGLYFGTLILVYWLASAASGADAYADAQWLLGSILGQLVLFGYTWALVHHMFGGIRHFIWDTGAMLDKHTASKLAWISLAGSITLTLAVWVAAYALMA